MLQYPGEGAMNRRKFAAAAVAAVAAPRALAFDRYEMPAEAQPHTRTFMQWPVSVDVYGERLLARVQAAIAGIAQNIARFEEVVVWWETMQPPKPGLNWEEVSELGPFQQMISGAGIQARPL